MDILFFAGQSNMQGQSEQLLDSRVIQNAWEYRYAQDALVPLQDPAGENLRGDGTPGYRVEENTDLAEWLKENVLGGACYGHTTLLPSFCGEYARDTGEEVCAVSVCRGSTTVSEWLPGTDGYALLKKKGQAAIRKAGGNGHRYLIWLQGESDAIFRTDTDTYVREMIRFRDAVCSDLGIEKIGIIRVGCFTGDERDQEIWRAQEILCMREPGFEMLTRIAGEMSRDPGYVHPLIAGHFSAYGLTVLGKTAAWAFRRILNGEKTVGRRIADGEEVFWRNPRETDEIEWEKLAISREEVREASERLDRFAPLIMRLFPETVPASGRIESPLREIPGIRERMNNGAKTKISRLLIKLDSDLPIAGSVKARGGIHEVLKHTEDLALANGLLTGTRDDYRKLAEPEARAFFGKHRIQVGSTGNLGLSIGIMSAALGYQAIVHMSSDAKQWKKDLLRSKGVTVREYSGDYGLAVENGRRLSEQDPLSYFVDDEHSRDLFSGYAVAGERLKTQLDAMGISVSPEQPLFVYIPCGVGGAPGGITFGLKQVFGNNVHVYFAEPVMAPCMLLGLVTGLNEKISVRDAGLSGQTQADGLAVGRCSGMVAGMMTKLLSGEGTVTDDRLNPYMRALWEREGIFIEPSSCAAFEALRLLQEEMPETEKDMRGKAERAVHIIWATGGSLVPDSIRKEMLG